MKVPGISGFAKAQDELPAGMSAKQDETKGAVFSFVGDKVKFVWMSIPPDDEIKISYILSLGSASEADLAKVTGTLAYLENNESVKAPIVTTSLPTGGASTPALAQNTIKETPVEKKEEPVQVQKTETPTPAKTTPEKPKTTPKPTTPVESTPAPVTAGIAYKVQICAGHEPVNVDVHFSKVYKFSEEKIYTENHEGWIKYIIGSYDTYVSAKQRRNTVTAGYQFPGPFVTAYNQGRRITVQEALMISKQKWTP